MGRAFQCDHCKKLFSGDVKNKVSISTTNKLIAYATPKVFELCNKCFLKIARVFNIKVEKNA